MKMEKGKFIYEGKAKQLYETDDKDQLLFTIKMMQQQEMEQKKELSTIKE